MSDEHLEKIGRYQVKARGFLVDSGLLVDSGVFLDSPDVRRIPIFLLVWPGELPANPGGTLEMMALQEPVSIRAVDEDGDKAVRMLMPKKAHTVRPIGVDEATGLTLYEYVWCPYVIPEPEAPEVEDRYDRVRGEVNRDALFEYGNKTHGFLRFEGVDYKVIVLNADGTGTLSADDEYLLVASSTGVIPLGAIFLGRIIGTHEESESPLFEGVPAKLPEKRLPKKRRRK
jgi:hypothetical protein